MFLRPSLIGLIGLAAATATAQPDKTLSGRWSASTMRASWKVIQWGTACGPRPNTANEAGGIVTVTQRGTELTLTGAGRTWSTNSCWEQLPGMRVTSHGSGGRSWQTTCASAPTDPRRASVHTVVTATDSVISLDETGTYAFAINEQRCEASVHRTRTYSLVEREGESRPIPPSFPRQDAPANEPAKPAEPAACSNPGASARVEVSPARKLLRRGESFTFRSRVLDSHGCVLPSHFAWTLAEPRLGVRVSQMGTVSATVDAPEGEADIVAATGGKNVTVGVTVVSPEHFSELLGQGRFNDAGEIEGSAVATLISSEVGTGSPVLRDAARGRRMVFIWTIGALAAVLAAAAVLLTRRRRLARGKAMTDASVKPEPSDSLVCLACGRQYASGTTYCASDGSQLVPTDATDRQARGSGGYCAQCARSYGPEVRTCPIHGSELSAPEGQGHPASSPPSGQRICPVCGTIYSAEHQFCGNDGAALVPVN